jgi:hypothetical protein
MALAFSDQYSCGFFRDSSHSFFLFSPEETFAVLGLYFSLKGKLVSDISFTLELLGKVSSKEYKFFSHKLENKKKKNWLF